MSAIQQMIMAAYGAAVWTPATLFAASEQGVWYDPSDFSTMFQDSAGTVPVTAVGQPVGKILDKSGRGNHATQATATARPVLSARVNLLTKTEDFSDAAWTKVGLTVTANQATAPSGSSASLVTANAAAGSKVLRIGNAINSAISSTKSTNRWVVKAAGYTRVALVSGDSGNSASAVGFFDLIGAGSLLGTHLSGALSATQSIQALGDGWYECVMSMVTAGSATDIGICPTPNNYVPGGNFPSFTGDGVSGILVADASGTTDSFTDYQRVNTATDYDTVGFPHGNDYDGVDDSMGQSGGGGSTTAFMLCAAVKPEGGAASARTIWSDAGTNTGYIVRLNASNQLEMAVGNGTAYTTIATTATVDVGTAYVVTAWDDGTNLNVQVNNGTVASVARPTVSAGTATATLGKNNGAATGFFNGQLISVVQVKNDGGTADERTAAKAYAAGKGGVTL